MAETASQANPTNSLIQLSDLIQRDTIGAVCFSITSLGEARVSLKGWKYRTLQVRDDSMESYLQIDEKQYNELKPKGGEYFVCKVKSRGIDNEGKLTVFFQNILKGAELGNLVASLRKELVLEKNAKKKTRKGPSVWQFHAREARGLLKLIDLYIKEKGPVHYSKLYPNQIVAEVLFRSGYAQRIDRGKYIPTERAMSLVKSHQVFPNIRIVVMYPNGSQIEDAPGATRKTIDEYLVDEADYERAIEEYKAIMRLLDEYPNTTSAT